MSYDDDIADRIRAVFTETHEITEQKMFGGLAFLVDGNMAIAASGQGGLLVRVDPADAERLLATTKARPMVMRGRELQGWLRLPPASTRTEEQLREWVALGVSYAASLPRKAPKKH